MEIDRDTDTDIQHLYTAFSQTRFFSAPNLNKKILIFVVWVGTCVTIDKNLQSKTTFTRVAFLNISCILVDNEIEEIFLGLKYEGLL